MIYNTQEIQKQFDKVLVYSQPYLFEDGNRPKTDGIFAKWREQKKDLINLLGGRLIYTLPDPVTFELSKDEKYHEIGELETKLSNISWSTSLPGLREFITDNSIVDFFNNIVKKTVYVKNCRLVSENTDEAQTIPKGMKVLKAFRYFVSNENLLREAQDMASEVIQKNKVTGKFCISVHPLDYLSMSESSYNWRSCHALDGEYRSGCLSYMCDPTTVICYLKGDEKAKLPRFPMDVPWNSKKWRMVVHLYQKEHQFMIAGRQYPFMSQGALDVVKQTIQDLGQKLCDFRLDHGEFVRLGSYEYGDWSNKNYTSADLEDKSVILNHCRSIGGLMVPLRSVIKKKKNYLHYDDVNLSHIYPHPHICQTDSFMSGIIPKIDIGCDSVPCPVCGEDTISRSSDMCCERCLDEHLEHNHICDYCGAVLTEAEVIYTPDGDIVCGRCWDENFSYCERCGAAFPSDEFEYDERTDNWYCPDCIEEIREEGEDF